MGRLVLHKHNQLFCVCVCEPIASELVKNERTHAHTYRRVATALTNWWTTRRHTIEQCRTHEMISSSTPMTLDYFNWPHNSFHSVSCHTWCEFERATFTSGVILLQQQSLQLLHSFQSVRGEFRKRKKIQSGTESQLKFIFPPKKKCLQCVVCSDVDCRKKFSVGAGEPKSHSKCRRVAWVWSNTFYSPSISYLP